MSLMRQFSPLPPDSWGSSVFLDASNMIKEKRIELETIRDKCYIIGFSVDFDLESHSASSDLAKLAAATLNVAVGAVRHPVFPCRFRRTNEGMLKGDSLRSLYDWPILSGLSNALSDWLILPSIRHFATLHRQRVQRRRFSPSTAQQRR